MIPDDVELTRTVDELERVAREQTFKIGTLRIDWDRLCEFYGFNDPKKHNPEKCLFNCPVCSVERALQALEE